MVAGFFGHCTDEASGEHSQRQVTDAGTEQGVVRPNPMTGSSGASRAPDCRLLLRHHLGADEDLREEGIGSDPVIAKVHRQLAEAGIEFETPFDVGEETGTGFVGPHDAQD